MLEGSREAVKCTSGESVQAKRTDISEKTRKKDPWDTWRDTTEATRQRTKGRKEMGSLWSCGAGLYHVGPFQPFHDIGFYSEYDGDPLKPFEDLLTVKKSVWLMCCE